MVNPSTDQSPPAGDGALGQDSQIIVDSCCDLSANINEWLGAKMVALTMRLGDSEFVDDDKLDLADFMIQMKNCHKPVGSASPPPFAYQTAFEHPLPSFAVTLSSKLSGSYNSAMMGKKMAEENGFGRIHVFDSKSASAGQTLIAIKLRELINRGLDYSSIIQTTEAFIDRMKTYFVLENYDNLQKNGRLSKVAGKLISVMNIKLLMGADGDGNIALFGKPRGMRSTLEKLISLIESSGKETAGESLVISHCNNESLARQLSQMIREKFRFKEIYLVPTGGISSLYADEKGIVVAF